MTVMRVLFPVVQRNRLAGESLLSPAFGSHILLTHFGGED